MRRNQRFSAEALRAARLRAGLSRVEVAQRVGVSEATVKGWENGTRAPKATSHAALAKALGVAPSVAPMGEFCLDGKSVAFASCTYPQKALVDLHNGPRKSSDRQ